MISDRAAQVSVLVLRTPTRPSRGRGAAGLYVSGGGPQCAASMRGGASEYTLALSQVGSEPGPLTPI